MKSTPAVLIIVGANLSSENRVMRLVFPTPESPSSRMRIVWSKSSPCWGGKGFRVNVSQKVKVTIVKVKNTTVSVKVTTVKVKVTTVKVKVKTQVRGHR